MTVLERLDVAAAAGIMEATAAAAPPPWMDPSFVSALRNVMVRQSVDWRLQPLPVP